jgi:hypothetical protein
MNAIVTAPVVELVRDINVINDMATELRPGMFATAQLGNPGDSSWSPCATLLLLHTNAVFMGAAQFTCLYQRTPGQYYIARFVEKHNQRERYNEAGGLEVGILYCTSSVPVDLATQSSPYLSERENDFLKIAMRFHREKVAAVPVAPRYKKDQLMAINHDD